MGDDFVVDLETGVSDERADAHTSGRCLDVAERVDAVDGDDGVGHRRFAVSGADDEVAAAGDRPSARGDRGECFVECGGNREVHD